MPAGMILKGTYPRKAWLKASSYLAPLIANIFVKLPLNAGDKHHALLSSALALSHLTDLDGDDFLQELADHDSGDHRIEEEYWKAVETAREKND